MKITHTFEEYLNLIGRIDESTVELKCGFVPNMLAPARVFISQELMEPLIEELAQYIKSKGSTFAPALIQVANVATLPGIVKHSIGLPDIHSGYGFAIGKSPSQMTRVF